MGVHRWCTFILTPDSCAIEKYSRALWTLPLLPMMDTIRLKVSGFGSGLQPRGKRHENTVQNSAVYYSLVQYSMIRCGEEIYSLQACT